MSAKTANVTARIQPEIKEQAEAILSQLGIPVSVFIDMAYRQVILRDGIPFSLDLATRLPTRDALSRDEFDAMMQTGLDQARRGESSPLNEAFARLRAGDLSYGGIYCRAHPAGRTAASAPSSTISHMNFWNPKPQMHS